MTSVLKDKNYLAYRFNVFFRLRGLLWPDILHSIPENIYLLPVALVAYGIINQYCLKMIGGPIGGTISDKILKSPRQYLCYTFIISTAAPRTVDYAAARKYAGSFRWHVLALAR